MDVQRWAVRDVGVSLTHSGQDMLAEHYICHMDCVGTNS